MWVSVISAGQRLHLQADNESEKLTCVACFFILPPDRGETLLKIFMHCVYLPYNTTQRSPQAAEHENKLQALKIDTEKKNALQSLTGAAERTQNKEKKKNIEETKSKYINHVDK